jgi:hypothetical protein
MSPISYLRFEKRTSLEEIQDNHERFSVGYTKLKKKDAENMLPDEPVSHGLNLY